LHAPLDGLYLLGSGVVDEHGEGEPLGGIGAQRGALGEVVGEPEGVAGLVAGDPGAVEAHPGQDREGADREGAVAVGGETVPAAVVEGGSRGQEVAEIPV